MANNAHNYQPTPRDAELLRAIAVLSPTSEQLLKWSRTFQEPIMPFTQIGDLRRRLRKLHAAGLVRRWRFAIESQGTTPYYYKLTLEGHRVLHGKDAAVGRSRSFSAIGLSLHSHTKTLADFIVHTKVAAHQIGASLADFYAENEYCVTIGDESLKLDGRFTLVGSGLRKPYNVELDNSTETILSPRETDTIARKIRLLDAADAQFEARSPQRAITLFVTSRSRERMLNILDAAATLVRNPDRSLVYGVYLADYLVLDDPLTVPCFLNHRHEPVALFADKVSSQTPPMFRQFPVSPAV